MAHSDNGLDGHPGVRRNFRAFTCILYCTGRSADGAPSWTEADGGALALYRGSEEVRDMAEVAGGQYAVERVLPLDGTLLIFDSRLVHEVEANTSPTGKTRTALTLWITRPTEERVMGEVWDEGAGATAPSSGAS